MNCFFKYHDKRNLTIILSSFSFDVKHNFNFNFKMIKKPNLIFLIIFAHQHYSTILEKCMFSLLSDGWVSRARDVLHP